MYEIHYVADHFMFESNGKEIVEIRLAAAIGFYSAQISRVVDRPFRDWKSEDTIHEIEARALRREVLQVLKGNYGLTDEDLANMTGLRLYAKWTKDGDDAIITTTATLGAWRGCSTYISFGFRKDLDEDTAMEIVREKELFQSALEDMQRAYGLSQDYLGKWMKNKASEP